MTGRTTNAMIMFHLRILGYTVVGVFMAGGSVFNYGQWCMGCDSITLSASPSIISTFVHHWCLKGLTSLWGLSWQSCHGNLLLPPIVSIAHFCQADCLRLICPVYRYSRLLTARLSGFALLLTARLLAASLLRLCHLWHLPPNNNGFLAVNASCSWHGIV